MSSHRCKVLVVEDEPLIGLDLQLLLQEAGYTVIGPATTVSEALVLANRHELRAALLDLNLNGEPATKVMNLLLEEAVPVVVLSGYTETAKEPPYCHCPFLQKPYAGDDVLRMLEVVISHSGMRETTPDTRTQPFC